MARACIRRFISCAFGLAVGLISTIAHEAGAQTVVDPNSRVSAVPGFGGTGLQGYYYDDVGGNRGVFDSAIANSIGPLMSPSAAATFLTTNICYPNCTNSFDDNSGGLAAFLGNNASNIVFTNPGLTPRNTWNDSGLIIDGYIAIANPGSYSFNLGSDDASVLRLGNYTGGSADLSFSASGLYQIAVNFTEDGGGSILRLTATSDSSGLCFLACSNGSGGLLANDVFYSQGQLDSAPAPTIGGGPSSVVLLVLLGAGAVYRRRQREIA